MPITVALNNLVNSSTGVKEYNVHFAGAILAALPTLIVYVVSGRYFVRGLMAAFSQGIEMAFLEISRLEKKFGAVDVLKGIDLDIEEGGFLVLVGPSGCGKSTLLNTIAGLESITAGEIRIAGRNVAGLHPSERDIAMVFQSYALYPNMTVAGNIGFGMEIRGVPKAEREAAIRQVSDMLQIDHLLDRKPSQLSGGQRQRVAMGRALVRRPQVFLFDEPLSNLDAKLRVDMRTEIKRLHQRLKTTIVYVTHDLIGQRDDRPVRIALPAGTLSNRNGQKIVFGIRPEAITDPDSADRLSKHIVRSRLPDRGGGTGRCRHLCRHASGRQGSGSAASRRCQGSARPDDQARLQSGQGGVLRSPERTPDRVLKLRPARSIA